MVRPLVDPRLLAAIPEAFPLSLTFAEAYKTQDAYGAESLLWSTYPYVTDDAGNYLVDDYGDLIVSSDEDVVACCLWPDKGTEVRRPDQTLSVATHRALLAGYRPDLTTEHRASMGVWTFDILAVEHDSQHTATRLLLEVVT